MPSALSVASVVLCSSLWGARHPAWPTEDGEAPERLSLEPWEAAEAPLAQERAAEPGDRAAAASEAPVRERRAGPGRGPEAPQWAALGLEALGLAWGAVSVLRWAIAAWRAGSEAPVGTKPSPPPERAPTAETSVQTAPPADDRELEDLAEESRVAEEQRRLAVQEVEALAAEERAARTEAEDEASTLFAERMSLVEAGSKVRRNSLRHPRQEEKLRTLQRELKVLEEQAAIHTQRQKRLQDKLREEKEKGGRVENRARSHEERLKLLPDRSSEILDLREKHALYCEEAVEKERRLAELEVRLTEMEEARSRRPPHLGQTTPSRVKLKALAIEEREKANRSHPLASPPLPLRVGRAARRGEGEEEGSAMLPPPLPLPRSTTPRSVVAALAERPAQEPRAVEAALDAVAGLPAPTTPRFRDGDSDGEATLGTSLSSEAFPEVPLLHVCPNLVRSGSPQSQPPQEFRMYDDDEPAGDADGDTEIHGPQELAESAPPSASDAQDGDIFSP